MTVAVVLAGGFGTRLRAAISDVPKPMAPVRGKPFLEHLLDYWIDQGVQRFILSVGYMHELILAHFGASYQNALIEYRVEHKPMGTGGALLSSASGLDQSFLLLNGDTFFAVPLEGLVAQHDTHKSLYTMCAFESSDLTRYTPLCLDDKDGIVSLSAPNRNEGLAWVNGGVAMIHPDMLRMPSPAKRPMSVEADWLPQLLTSGVRAQVMRCTGTFIDIGLPSDYYYAEKVLP